jgi:hypothetical protein
VQKREKKIKFAVGYVGSTAPRSGTSVCASRSAALHRDSMLYVA